MIDGAMRVDLLASDTRIAQRSPSGQTLPGRRIVARDADRSDTARAARTRTPREPVA